MERHIGGDAIWPGCVVILNRGRCRCRERSSRASPFVNRIDSLCLYSVASRASYRECLEKYTHTHTLYTIFQIQLLIKIIFFQLIIDLHPDNFRLIHCNVQIRLNLHKFSFFHSKYHMILHEMCISKNGRLAGKPKGLIPQYVNNARVSLLSGFRAPGAAIVRGARRSNNV